MPTDDPRAEAIGPDPDRVLLLGPGKSIGLGVRTHQLGLGGHLARELSSITRRGCSVDIVTDPSMSAADTGVVVEWARLKKYDALVLTLGGGDAVRMRSLFAWRRDVTSLLDTVEVSGGGALHSFIIGITPADEIFSLPESLLRIVNGHIAKLNSITEQLCAVRPNVTFVPATPPAGSVSMPFESRTYAHWARELAPGIAARLVHVAVPPSTSTSAHINVAAFDSSVVAIKPASTTLTAIMHSACLMLGTSGAAISFHDQDASWFTSTNGDGDLRRDEAEAFCNSVRTTPGLTVLEDTLHDAQFSEHSWASRDSNFRFFAGYPILAPNGDAIGAVCVFDTEPRTFDSSHESLLRELALRAQSAIQLQ